MATTHPAIASQETLISKYYSSQIQANLWGRWRGILDEVPLFDAKGDEIFIPTTKEFVGIDQTTIAAVGDFAVGDIEVVDDQYVKITKEQIATKLQVLKHTLELATTYDQAANTIKELTKHYLTQVVQYKLANFLGDTQFVPATKDEPLLNFIVPTGTGSVTSNTPKVTQKLNPLLTDTGNSITSRDLRAIRATFEAQGFNPGMDPFCLMCGPHVYEGLLADPNFIRADAIGSAKGLIRGEIGFLYGIKIISSIHVPYATKSGSNYDVKTNIKTPLTATHAPCSVAFVASAVGQTKTNAKLYWQREIAEKKGSGLYILGHEGAGRLRPRGEGVILLPYN